MDNIAYLHLAFAYEETESSDLVSLSYLFNTAATPDWKRLSSRAWKHMLPLALTLSILGSVTSVWALERGDQGPSVRTLQQKLQQAGFYQAPVTQVYDFTTEAAVRSFQQAAGLPVDGVVGASTLEKLDNWRLSPVSNQTPKPTTPSTQTVRQNNTTTVPTASRQTTKPTNTTKVPTVSRQTTKPTNTTKVPTVSRQTTKPTSTASRQTTKPTSTASTQKRNTTASTQTKNTTANSPATNKRSNPNYLVKGDEGENVKLLQQRLKVAGFYYGNATGIFGPITEEAVKRFQAAYKLDVDGVVGPNTLRKLPPIGVGGENSPKSTTSKDKLSLGDRGEAVRVLQEQLIRAGYLQGQPNGYFGPYTADAVKRFQSANYLTASGVAGPTTRAKLYGSVNKAAKSDFNVLEIQRRLQEKGFYKGQLNGVMADDTKKAIKQAQEFYGISLNDVKSGRF